MCHTLVQYYIHCAHTDVHFIYCDKISWYPDHEGRRLSIRNRDHSIRRGVAHSYERMCHACASEKWTARFMIRQRAGSTHGYGSDRGATNDRPYIFYYSEQAMNVTASLRGGIFGDNLERGGDERPSPGIVLNARGDSNNNPTPSRTENERQARDQAAIGQIGALSNEYQEAHEYDMCVAQYNLSRAEFPRMNEVSAREIDATIRSYVNQEAENPIWRRGTPSIRLPDGRAINRVALELLWRTISDPHDAIRIWREITRILMALRDRDRNSEFPSRGRELHARLRNGSRLTPFGEKLVIYWLSMLIKEYHIAQRRTHQNVEEVPARVCTRRQRVMRSAWTSIERFTDQFNLLNLDDSIEVLSNNLVAVTVLSSEGELPSPSPSLSPVLSPPQALAAASAVTGQMRSSRSVQLTQSPPVIRRVRNVPTHNRVMPYAESLDFKVETRSSAHGDHPIPSEKADTILFPATHRLLVHFAECDHYNAVTVPKPINHSPTPSPLSPAQTPPTNNNDADREGNRNNDAHDTKTQTTESSNSLCGCHEFPLEFLTSQHATSKGYCLVCRNERMYRWIGDGDGYGCDDVPDGTEQWKQFIFERQVEMVGDKRRIALWPMETGGFWEALRVEYR